MNARAVARAVAWAPAIARRSGGIHRAGRADCIGGLAVATRMVAAVAVTLLAGAPGVSAAQGCADFLAAAGHKPPHLEFVECALGREAQLRVLHATYRVNGGHAAGVERYLVRHTHMPRLRFICCGWEPWAQGAQARHGTLAQGRQPAAYAVTMVSGETLVSRRANWAQIPTFQVRVTRYLDLP